MQEIAKVQDVEGEKYEWILAKNGFNHRFTLEDKGNGFTITLLGINQLDEYSSGPAAPQGTGVVAAEVSNLSAAEKLQQTAGTSLPDGYMSQVDLKKNPDALLGDFSEGTSVMRGVETVTDARGNVLVSNFKTRTSMTQTQGIPTGPSVNIAGYDFDGIPKTWKDYINPSINRINSYNSTQRLGSSVVSSSQRSTRGFTLGLGKGNSDLVSIGVGFQ